MPLRLATRGSALALAQAGGVAEMLGGAELVEVASGGEPGDKSRFVRGVERAVLEGAADLGVHSAKDLPAGMPEELMIAGVPAREDPCDAWVGPAASLDEVPRGARVGTASLRRRSQLLAIRPDLALAELHGNVDTRLGRLGNGDFDAVVLAGAGLRRLGREAEISFRLADRQMLPAAGQGALVLQARRDEAATLAACAAISDPSSLLELTAERAAIGVLGADCSSPVAVRARAGAGGLSVEGYAGLPDGSRWVRESLVDGGGDAAAAGRRLGEALLGAGAGELLERAAAARPPGGKA
ncbi:MAG: hydroxymethylbilane synthase [Solirubrobacterales bacterium]